MRSTVGRNVRLSATSPVLVDLGIPALPQFLLHSSLAFRLAKLHFYTFACSQNLALKVETAALLRIVQIEQLLEPLHNMLEVGFAAGRGLDVQDLAGLIKGQTRRGESATATLLLCSIFARGLSLLVGFGEGAAEYPGSSDDDLGDDAMSLERGRKLEICFQDWMCRGLEIAN